MQSSQFHVISLRTLLVFMILAGILFFHIGLAEGQQSNSNSAATGTPTISGTAQVGETLTADTTGIADSNGLQNAEFTYSWLAKDSGTDYLRQVGNSSTYEIQYADAGMTIRVRVSLIDDGGYPEMATSSETSVVFPAPNIVATGVPTISGVLQAGQTLTASIVDVQDGNGFKSGGYISYQWIST